MNATTKPALNNSDLQIRIIRDSALRLERGEGEIGEVECLARAYRRQDVDTWDLYVAGMTPAGVVHSADAAVRWITMQALAAN